MRNIRIYRYASGVGCVVIAVAMSIVASSCFQNQNRKNIRGLNEMEERWASSCTTIYARILNTNAVVLYLERIYSMQFIYSNCTPDTVDPLAGPLVAYKLAGCGRLHQNNTKPYDRVFWYLNHEKIEWCKDGDTNGFYEWPYGIIILRDTNYWYFGGSIPPEVARISTVTNEVK